MAVYQAVVRVVGRRREAKPRVHGAAVRHKKVDRGLDDDGINGGYP
jgi:hypothetical protein